MTRWEYRYVDVPDMEWDDVEPLSEAGREGWRFTGYATDTGHGTRFLMERQITP